MMNDTDSALVREAIATEAHNLACDVAGAATAPHVLMRPRVYPDGNAWCALYGDNIQDGVCGFGDTPEAACEAFDREWWHGPAGTPAPEAP